MTTSSQMIPQLSVGDTGTFVLDGYSGAGEVVVQANGASIVTSLASLHRFLPDGTPDLSFMQTGTVYRPLGSQADGGWIELYGPTLLDGGKMLVTGASNTPTQSSLLIGRLNADGSLDTSFGTNGQSESAVDAKTLMSVVATRLLADGKILVISSDWDKAADGSSGSAQAVHTGFTRYLANGKIDTSFGKAGFLLDTRNLQAFDALVQSDGKIVVAGIDRDTDRYVILRFKADGSRDSDFGDEGELQPLLATHGATFGLAQQPDGKLLITGNAQITGPFDIGVATMRLNLDGSVDRSFGVNGLYNDNIFGNPYGGSGEFIHVNDDGTILISGSALIGAGTGIYQPYVIRLHANGTLDTTFGKNGVATVELPKGMAESARGISIGADGRIVMIGDMASIKGGLVSTVFNMFDADGHAIASIGPASVLTVNSASYTQGYLEQFLNPHISVSNQQGLDNYDGAMATLARVGGANAADHFTAANGVSFVDGKLVVKGLVIGSVSEGGGTLTLTFNGAATQVLVDTALQGIAYYNSGSFTHRQHISIGWNFSTAAGVAQVSTDLTLQAADAPYWIDTLLARSSPVQSATQLRTDLLNLLSDSRKLDLQFASDPGAKAFSEADQAFISAALGKLTGVLDLQLGNGGGTAVVVHHSASLAAGETSATGITQGHGDVHASFGTAAASANPVANLNALLHALEHMLGLQHATLPAADDHANLTLMSDGAAIGTAAGLGVLDIAALQFIYGPSKTARAGNDTYQLSLSGANFIWDGDGSDTISAVGLDSDVTLHLEPGHWDYIGTQGATITAAGQITVNYGSVIENAIGGSGNDKLTGSSAVNSLSGGAGKDVLTGLGGNDVLDGGDGIDTAVYLGKLADYVISKTATGWSVSDSTGKEGVDQLQQIERLQFSDHAVAIDDGAVQLYRLYQAAFDRAPDLSGLSYWLSQQDDGASLRTISGFFQGSAEFIRLYGASLGDEAFVTQLYKNVLHRAPDASGLAFWVGHLQTDITRADALLSFSESEENVVALVGAVEHGVLYIPH